jgi:hypothetical protein
MGPKTPLKLRRRWKEGPVEAFLINLLAVTSEMDPLVLWYRLSIPRNWFLMNDAIVDRSLLCTGLTIFRKGLESDWSTATGVFSKHATSKY